ncbi:hypothetical protein AMJ39_06945 [candidate division TA06 bacterium DG_24]|uniref:Uncharacterized protein n=3 Tax=Bacteria division TA06 TaxID=1156500 RepID=A0A0S8JBJ9_UNCT6|nr:MAG: hypothetical protein AMJ39_06945 [candidate division TA06 bacterium DG_24]KPK68522.1 MAG: hypothetical protein AMJ82_08055 [candidate division TA06 bacterium SM23_40]KPL06722.1 MAG: hypothetical protein AMJ71_09500 [candidate division TA06 bacterium SM1_40]
MMGEHGGRLRQDLVLLSMLALEKSVKSNAGLLLSGRIREAFVLKVGTADRLTLRHGDRGGGGVVWRYQK